MLSPQSLGMDSDVKVTCVSCLECASRLDSEEWLARGSHHLSFPPPRLSVFLQDWIGLGRVEPAALWLLFLSFAASVLQVHTSSWMRRVLRESRLQTPEQLQPLLEAGGPQGQQAQLSRGSSSNSIAMQQGAASEAAPHRTSEASREAGTAGATAEIQHTVQHSPSPPQIGALFEAAVFRGGSNAPASSAAGALDSSSTDSLLWQPLTLAAQGRWRWQDWGRYALYR